METVVQPPADAELQLLTRWGAPDDRSRLRGAAAISVAIHIALVVLLAVLPESVLAPIRQAATARITPLIEPLTELTQTPPNTRKISKEFDATEMTPRPRIQIPTGPLSTTRPQAARPAVLPPPAPKSAAAPALPEPPKATASLNDAPRISSELPQAAQAPQIQPVERPKIAFETPGGSQASGTGNGRIAAPNTSVAEAIRGAVRGSAGGLMVGDPIGGGPGGYGEGINLPPSPGSQGSALELLSDPQGVDFRPYLIRILAAVRRNWTAVLPESARMGRMGRVGIQFSIARNGSVPKLVIVSQSGTDAFDRAAVAGISASNPFPPLPSEFKGDQIRLQFNFAYNIPKR